MCYRKDFKGYKCTNSQMGAGRCTAHSCKEEELKEIISSDLRQYVLSKLNDKDIYNGIDKFLYKREDPDKTIKTIDSELNIVDRKFQELYIDKFNRKISERNFEILSKPMEKKQQELINRKKDCISNLVENDTYNEKYNAYKSEVMKTLNFQNLDRVMVENLIEKIIISEDKQMKQKSIDIYYKFEI
jgi:ribosome-binding ATPase YchF (GTP1/OBG family)